MEDIANYERVAKIGAGGQATILKVRYKPTGELFALKVMSKQRDKRMLENFAVEAQILKDIDNPTIVKYRAAMQSSKSLYIVLELCDADLEKVLSIDTRSGAVSNPVNETTALKYIRQIAVGIDYLHNEQQVIHRDIKLGNILLCDDIVKITDFGFATKVRQYQKFTTAVGTPLALPPEIVQNREYSYPVDVWSLGVLAFLILHGYYPFDVAKNVPREKVRDALYTKILYFEPEISEQLSAKTQDLLRELLNKNQNTRITIAEVLRHPALNEGTVYYVPVTRQTIPMAPVRASKLERSDWLSVSIIGPELESGSLVFVGVRGEDDLPKVFETDEAAQEFAGDNGFVFMMELP